MVPQICVIVPVYKVEKYIHRCVDSILAQTLQRFELVLVDDGSPDGCGAICDAYALTDPRVRVLHRENGEKMVYIQKILFSKRIPSLVIKLFKVL